MGAGRARPSCPGAFPAGAARGKRAGAARGKKGARCGAGEKGRCGTGSGRPFVSREKVPKGPAGPAPSPSRQQGRAGKKGKGGFPFFPALGVPGQCAGDADGAGAAGPRDVRRGQSRRCGVSPKRDAPKGHRAAKKGGRRGRKSAPGALPFSLCGPFGAAAHVFWNFLRRPSDTESIGRVRTRRRCRRRDFAGRPPRCRPRGRWSGGCRQRGARPPRQRRARSRPQAPRGGC